MDFVKVCFLKAGTPYGYGYKAGEIGLAKKADLEDQDWKDDKGKPHTKKGLLSLGVVRHASDKEYTEAIEAEQAKLGSRRAALRSPATAGSGSAETSDEIPKLRELLGEAVQRMDVQLQMIEAQAAKIVALENAVAELKAAQAAPAAPPAAPAEPAEPEKGKK